MPSGGQIEQLSFDYSAMPAGCSERLTSPFQLRAGQLRTGEAGPRADRRASRTADHRDARHGVGLKVENSRPSGRPRNPF
jgi:hypothetical protein